MKASNAEMHVRQVWKSPRGEPVTDAGKISTIDSDATAYISMPDTNLVLLSARYKAATWAIVHDDQRQAAQFFCFRQNRPQAGAAMNPVTVPATAGSCERSGGSSSPFQSSSNQLQI